MLLVLLALVVPIAYASPYTSGVGRLNDGGSQLASFSLESYEDAVENIFASLTAGPNRTLSDSVPVDKVYGVNVSRRSGTEEEKNDDMHRSATG